MPDQPKRNLKVRRFMDTVSNLILHLHPAKVPLASIRFSHTFGLGGMAALLIMLQILTGLLLKFQYIPSVDLAYRSIEAIREEFVFGQFILNIHHWSGQFLIIITFLHLARVIFTSAYFPPRGANWLIGLGLLLIVILMNFTGYLLPWDQLSYWAVTVAGSMLDYVPVIGQAAKLQLLGGNHVGQATLMNFYHYHTGLLPLLMVILMAYHFWKVRKAKGVLIPALYREGEEKTMVPVIPELVRKELVTALVLLAIILLFSLMVDAPLLEKANPTISPDPAKAPWYFLGIQELIVHIHPLLSVFLVPLLMLLAFILIPYSGRTPVNTGTWFSSPKAKKKLLGTLIFTFILIPAWILVNEFISPLGQWITGTPLWISEGMVPFILFTAIVFLAGWFMLDRYRLPYNELIMNGFVFISASYLILMVTGIFLRGPGMELSFLK